MLQLIDSLVPPGAGVNQRTAYLKEGAALYSAPTRCLPYLIIFTIFSFRHSWNNDEELVACERRYQTAVCCAGQVSD